MGWLSKGRLAATVSSTFLVMSCGAGGGNGGSQSSGVVLVVDIETGDLAPRSQQLINKLSGDLEPDRSLLVAAACHNIEQWLDDRALDNALVTGTSARLVRAAELVAVGDVDPLLASALEAQYLASQPLSLSPDLASNGFSDRDVADYSARVTEQPSPSAVSRFVVYAVSRTTDNVSVTYLDLSLLPAPRLSGRRDAYDSYLAVDGELVDQRVEESECIAE